MIYVLISVCCSVLVGVLIKLARQKQVNVQQLVLWNYPTTVVLTYLLLQPHLQGLRWNSLPYQFYIPLTFLLPSLFIFIALAVKYSGIVKTDVAQRMSLFIPLIASFVIFNEVLKVNKLIGIAVGLIAVACSVSWGKAQNRRTRKNSVYPIIVFVGMGFIDILFKQIALYSDIPYTTSMFIVFVGAMIFAFLILLYRVGIQKKRLDKSAIVWGLILGLFNFANIYYYMKAHRAIADNPSIVFTAMNVGVIVLGSLVGVFLFNEKLSLTNKIGLVLAVVSILLIAYL
ncbi:DMT family transporter [Sphingobacterium litopenaei]|uniref:DMT family transporter n=1 Tax=Sphingobacterium litopenaei TaxID=2763500 RepID=A0ABR7YB73_9SPHI|nr:DMT family transporter [Sphingobacterium litopenaei]MBD1428568.1 DMT family transporter [Sphingobacterium litopenaei]